MGRRPGEKLPAEGIRAGGALLRHGVEVGEGEGGGQLHDGFVWLHGRLGGWLDAEREAGLGVLIDLD